MKKPTKTAKKSTGKKSLKDLKTKKNVRGGTPKRIQLGDIAKSPKFGGLGPKDQVGH